MYRKTSQGWLKHWDFMVIDIVCLNAVFVLAYILRNGLPNLHADVTYFRLAVIFTLVDILVILFFNSLRDVLKRGDYKEGEGLCS